MRKAWFLTIAGVIGLIMALSIEGHIRGVSDLQPDGPISMGPMIYRMGFPDGWLEWESSPNSHSHIMGVHFDRWSFAILVASVCAICSAVVLRMRTPKLSEPSA